MQTIANGSASTTSNNGNGNGGDNNKQAHAIPFGKLPLHVMTNPDLKRGDGELYALLGTYWRKNREVCWPSQATLATKMRESVDTVRRRLKRLETAELIEVKRRGLTKPNEYKRLSSTEAAPVHVQEAAPVQDEVEKGEVDLKPVCPECPQADISVAREIEQTEPLDEEAEAQLARLSKLNDYDANTIPTFRRQFSGVFDRLGPAIWYALDELSKRQWRAQSGRTEPVVEECAYVFGIVNAIAIGVDTVGYAARTDEIEALFDDADEYEQEDDAWLPGWS